MCCGVVSARCWYLELWGVMWGVRIVGVPPAALPRGHGVIRGRSPMRSLESKDWRLRPERVSSDENENERGRGRGRRNSLLRAS